MALPPSPPPANVSPSQSSVTKAGLHSDRYAQEDAGFAADWDEPADPVRGERAVWQAVIMQALTDAASNSKKSEARQHKLQALEWLLGGSDDFHDVCDYAGLHPDYVKRKVKEALARGCRWRATPGEKSSNVTRLPAPPFPISRKSAEDGPPCTVTYFPLRPNPSEAIRV